MFQSYSKRWMDQYSALGLLVLDPTVHWGMNNVGWVLWRDLEAIDKHGVFAHAKGYGLMNGVTISTLKKGSRSIASFARSDRDYELEEIAELEMIFTDLHEVTASDEALTNGDRLALKDLSVRLTH
jgi:LuxR family transcriptional regulator